MGEGGVEVVGLCLDERFGWVWIYWLGCFLYFIFGDQVGLSDFFNGYVF